MYPAATTRRQCMRKSAVSRRSDYDVFAERLSLQNRRYGSLAARRLRQFLAIVHFEAVLANKNLKEGATLAMLDGTQALNRALFSFNGPVQFESAEVLESLAWFWRYFDKRYDEELITDLNDPTWTSFHEHQLKLFRLGCAADQSDGCHQRSYAHRAQTCAPVQSGVRPLNLMINFVSARGEVLHRLNKRAASVDLAESARQQFRGNSRTTDQAPNNSNAMSCASRSLVACDQASNAVDPILQIALATRNGRCNFKLLFAKARLREVDNTAHCSTFTFQELLLVTQLLHMPLAASEAWALFLILGGSQTQLPDTATMEGLLMGFWLIVAQFKRDTDDAANLQEPSALTTPDTTTSLKTCRSPWGLECTQEEESHISCDIRNILNKLPGDEQLKQAALLAARSYLDTIARDGCDSFKGDHRPQLRRNTKERSFLRAGTSRNCRNKRADSDRIIEWLRAEHLLIREQRRARVYHNLRCKFLTRVNSLQKCSSMNETGALESQTDARRTEIEKRQANSNLNNDDNLTLQRRRETAAAARIAIRYKVAQDSGEMSRVKLQLNSGNTEALSKLLWLQRSGKLTSLKEQANKKRPLSAPPATKLCHTTQCKIRPKSQQRILRCRKRKPLAHERQLSGSASEATIRNSRSSAQQNYKPNQRAVSKVPILEMQPPELPKPVVSHTRLYRPLPDSASIWGAAGSKDVVEKPLVGIKDIVLHLRRPATSYNSAGECTLVRPRANAHSPGGLE